MSGIDWRLVADVASVVLFTVGVAIYVVGRVDERRRELKRREKVLDLTGHRRAK